MEGRERMQMTYWVGAAIARRGDSLLLVREVAESSEIGWSLPGGVIEEGEDPLAAVMREVKEETSLHVSEVLGLAYSVIYNRPEKNDRTCAFVFEVTTTGNIVTDDMDSDILEAKFIDLPVAINLLDQFPIRVMVEPAIAFLKKETPPGMLWVYENVDGKTQLTARVAPHLGGGSVLPF
ncbi:MAG: NUDIX hydrolase [Candidatus Nanopelagicaceae bacterium]|nr:NUDIX hydrolase [Candidatus Nanopelagicaceae bacterium]